MPTSQLMNQRNKLPRAEDTDTILTPQIISFTTSSDGILKNALAAANTVIHIACAR